MEKTALSVHPSSWFAELQLPSLLRQKSARELTAEKFQETVMPYKNKLYRFAYSYLHNEDDAKDVVQDVLIKTWETLRGNAQINNIEAWCMTLTKNRSLDKLKRKGNNSVPIEDQYHLSAEVRNPHEKTEQEDLVRKVRETMKELPENQRNVLRLKDMEGYSYKEIGEILKLDMSLVKVSLHRARAFVRTRISKISAYGIE